MAQGDFTRINTNIGALNALNSLKNVQSKLGQSQLRLATGKRINEAADDPSGLTIATKFQYRASGLGVALDNIGDGKNLLAVAEGGLTKIKDILVKMRDKTNAAASDTLGTDERAAIQDQLESWSAEINNIVDTTKWNGNKLLDGLSAFANTKITFQVGVENDAAERLELDGTSFTSVTASELGIGSGAATVTEITDADTGFDNYSAANARVSGLQELGNGTYTMQVVIGATTDGSEADSYIQLQDSQGNPLVVDANGDGAAGLTDNKVAFAYNTAAAKSINFGNGLSLDIEAGLAATNTRTGTFTYARGGTYSGDVTTAAGAQSALDDLDDAIEEVSARLQDVGTLVSRMNFREETVTVAKVNVEAAFSRVMNADMAWEQLEATKYQILQQTATAMLSQANSAPQGILQLFQ